MTRPQYKAKGARSRSLANARSLAGSRPHPAMAVPAAANAPGVGPLGRWGGATPRPFGQGPLPPPPGLPARLLRRSGPPAPPRPFPRFAGSPRARPAPFRAPRSGARFCAPAAGGVGPGRRGPGGCAPAPWRPLHGSCPPRQATPNAGWVPAQFAALYGPSDYSLAPARPPSLLWLRSAPSGYNQALGGGQCPRPRYARGSLRYAVTIGGSVRWGRSCVCLFRSSPRCRSFSSSLGQVYYGCRRYNYLGAALPLALRAIATLRESAGAPFPRLSFRAGPQFPALFPPLATLAPCGLRGDRSRAKARTVFGGYARPRQRRPACFAGTRSGGAGAIGSRRAGGRGVAEERGQRGRCRVLQGFLGRSAGREGTGDPAGRGYRRRAGQAGVAQSRLSPAFIARRFISLPRAVPMAPTRPRRNARPLFSRPVDLPALLHATPTAFCCPRPLASPFFARTPCVRLSPLRPRSAASRYARRGRRFRGQLRAAHRRRRRRFSNRAVNVHRCTFLGERFETFARRQQRRMKLRDQITGCWPAASSPKHAMRRNFFFNSIFQKQSYVIFGEPVKVVIAKNCQIIYGASASDDLPIFTTSPP